MKLINSDGPKAMTVDELYKILAKLIEEDKGHYSVDVLTELKHRGQVQQELGGVNLSEGRKLVILTPIGF